MDVITPETWLQAEDEAVPHIAASIGCTPDILLEYVGECVQHTFVTARPPRLVWPPRVAWLHVELEEAPNIARTYRRLVVISKQSLLPGAVVSLAHTQMLDADCRGHGRLIVPILRAGGYDIVQGDPAFPDTVLLRRGRLERLASAGR